jgi:diaminohydroxyphosphoribosylaminopyrimidine deaminase/5-amino-6-(5-phosphoribosylamino)uracil reductase
MVGCVFVKAGRIIGEGYHRRYGGPHAEVEALRSVRGAARGSTAYVTLEPCCHFGKTPPCTNALIEAGVKRVVFAVRDPFPKVRGKSAKLLRAAGMDIVSGVCEREAIDLMAPYIKGQKLGLPWVILKWAQSLDGKIATRTGDSKWISNQQSRKLVHQIRARMDAIIVGVGTVMADDPALTARDVPVERVATRIILDPHLRIPPLSQLVRSARETPTIIVKCPSAPQSKSQIARRYPGIEILAVPAKREELNLKAMLQELSRRGMSNVLVEGGGRTLGAFYDAGLADEAFVFVSPRLIGGRDAPSALSATGPARMSQIKPPRSLHISQSGDDQLYHLRLSDPALWRS